MTKATALATTTAALLLSMPAIVLAQETPVEHIPIVPPTLQWILSLVGLGVATLGLYFISKINTLTKGGAISGRAAYIIVAFMLLGVSSILNVAVYSFQIEINYDFVAHIDQALRIVAMGFFVLYFHRVLAGLRDYMEDLQVTEQTFIDDATATEASSGE